MIGLEFHSIPMNVVNMIKMAGYNSDWKAPMMLLRWIIKAGVSL
jgi:hypothetical protein